MRQRTLFLSTSIMAVAMGLGVSACAGTNNASATTAATGGYPVTVENCGNEITIARAPKRVVVIDRNEVPLISAVGAIGTVVAKAGNFPAPPGLFDAQTNAAIEKVPTIGGETTNGGTVPISLESVLAQNPDLVVGVTTGSGITRAALEQSHIPLVEDLTDTGCTQSPHATLDKIYTQVELYGKVFNRQHQAAETVANLRSRVAKMQRAAGNGGSTQTAAALFVPIGGKQVSIYGNASIVHAQMQAAGLTNVFGALDERATKVDFEQVLQRNPDDLIVLTIGDHQKTMDSLLAIPGASDLNAVRNHRVFVMDFDYTEPPTPTSVEGLSKLIGAFGSKK
jgi:iron complex transport system substrate-binding protein